METISAYGEIAEELKRQVRGYKFENRLSDAGRVVACGDGVLTVEGLPNVKNGELLYIGRDKYALAMNLEEYKIGAILLADSYELSEGDIAYSTGKIVGVPVGDALLGRVVNPLGVPLDGGKPITSKKYRSVEAPAPAIFDRANVNRPLLTGIKAIDSMIPVGKGQRELIIGDRQTGKTALAVDTIINQKGKNVVCVYVAIGQKTSSVNSVIQTLKQYGALDYTVVVCSTASESAPLQYIAPYTGTAIAEEFMYGGRDVLIVYDDLSKHAVAYRAISLLLKRPSGREAYPGDVFYIHSRLLERSAKLSKELGGGSLTALPIIETLAGDISAYIPTNVISITDGQIYLESELFRSGIRPAVNVGLSVSRVGGAAQCKAMKKVSGKVRLDLAHYREMAQFSQFGAELDDSTKSILGKGARLTEILKQNQASPVSMSHTVIALTVMMNDLFSDIPVREVNAAMDNFLDFLEANHAELPARIEETQELSDEDAELIKTYVAAYKSRSGGGTL
ncbi:MAG: F0F1 ATP synthase subunit alpha [Christensenellaceae bacterium]|jgi:ATP synthase F1, alpha subunit|nr:F0F1 ATP synthase subunit alpha [Clostridia bacterium]PWM01559.1 MAG: F0F1 ATP synthase subunit alpha [Clostridiales bacterium]